MTRWNFTQFGDDIVIATGGAPLKYNLLLDTAVELGGTPPTADLCATVRDFVVFGRVNSNNQLIGWSGQGDCEEWTGGVNGSGEQPLYSGGKVMGLVGGEYGLILQRFAVKRMSYTGDNNLPFQFDDISTNYGCIAEGSIATAGRLTFFYSDRGFVVCDGTDVKPIGAEMYDAWFRARYAETDLENMWAAIDPVRTLVIWSMPGALLMYNWMLSRPTLVELPVKAIFNSFSEATTLGDLDGLYGDLDAVPYSLDDPRFSGGSPRLTVVHFDGRFGVLTGDNLAATFETPFIELANSRTARLKFVRPVTDAIEGLTLTADSRQRLGDASNGETFTALHASGDMPVRIAARSAKLTLDIAAGTAWDYAQGLELEFMVGGRR